MILLNQDPELYQKLLTIFKLDPEDSPMLIGYKYLSNVAENIFIGIDLNGDNSILS
jgi:hypothetical protein